MKKLLNCFMATFLAVIISAAGVSQCFSGEHTLKAIGGSFTYSVYVPSGGVYNEI